MQSTIENSSHKEIIETRKNVTVFPYYRRSLSFVDEKNWPVYSKIAMLYEHNQSNCWLIINCIDRFEILANKN